MDEDFLATDFKAAEVKLKKAIKACKGRCSDSLKAALHRDLGVLYIAGMNRPKNGVTELKKALSLDPDLTFDVGLLSSDVKEQILKAGAKPGTLLHDPPVEAAAGYPVPMTVATLGRVSEAEAWVVYRRIGEGRWRELELNEGIGEYVGHLPCDVVSEPGSVEYFLELRRGDAVISSAFSAAEPEALTLAEDGGVLSLPGEAARSACTTDESDQDEATDASSEGEKKFWMQAGIQQDFALMGGDAMCTGAAQENDGYYCFTADGAQYTGKPDPSRPSSVEGGFVAATTRFLVGVDYALTDSFSVGSSIGFAAGEGPTPIGGTSFPVHFEARGAYWFVGDRALPTGGFGFYGVGVAGLAQIDAKVKATVHETDPFGVTRSEVMTVWQKMGRQFLAAGVGGFLPLGNDAEYGAARLEVRYTLTLPDTGSAVSPNLSYAYGF